MEFKIFWQLNVKPYFVSNINLYCCRRKTNTATQKPERRDTNTHTSVAIVTPDDHYSNNHINRPAPVSHSPTPSRASSLATIKTNCTQSHGRCITVVL